MPKFGSKIISALKPKLKKVAEKKITEEHNAVEPVGPGSKFSVDEESNFHDVETQCAAGESAQIDVETQYEEQREVECHTSTGEIYKKEKIVKDLHEGQLVDPQKEEKCALSYFEGEKEDHEPLREPESRASGMEPPSRISPVKTTDDCMEQCYTPTTPAPPVMDKTVEPSFTDPRQDYNLGEPIMAMCEFQDSTATVEAPASNPQPPIATNEVVERAEPKEEKSKPEPSKTTRNRETPAIPEGKTRGRRQR